MCSKIFLKSVLLENVEKSRRGYYEQVVSSLLPCSVFQWENMSAENNFTLSKDYLFTEVEMSKFDFSPSNMKIHISDESVELA